MALSTELRTKILQQAKDIDKASADVTARVATTAKNQQSAQSASRLDNPINSPTVMNKRSAQVAQRLDNSLINMATKGTTNPAEMYRPGNVTESLFKTPNYVSNNAMTEMVDRASARLALQQDNTATVKAREATTKSAEQQKAAMERMVADLYQQMEGYKNNGQTAELSKAEQQYAKLNESIANMQSKINGNAMEEAADWEAKQYNEIMSTGGRVLMASLERLAELSDTRIKEANDERRNGLTETETEYYDLYNNLKSKYGEQVDSWLEYAKRAENKSQMAMRMVKAEQAAENHPFWTSVGSVPLNMASGAGYMDVLGQKLQRYATGSDAPIDYNSPAQSASKMTNTIRGTVSKGMGNVGSFLYNTGMSIADSLVARQFGGFGMALLGGSAATNAMQTAIDRGASDEQALKIGILAGAMETVMEKASVDSLFKLKDAKTAKAAILNILKQAGAEGTEEGLTNLANTLADYIVMGNKSELNTARQAYIDAGDNPDEAEAKALKEWGLGLLTDVAGGALSGGVFGSFKTGSDVIRNGGFERPAVADITPTVRQEAAKPNPNQKWEKFFAKNNGTPSATAFQSFTANMSEADSAAFIAYLDEQEKAGNLKWRGDGTPVLVMPAEDHIDNRDYVNVGDPKVKSFQYNNPELQPFIQEGLQILADDLDHTLPGERYYNGIDPNGVGSQGLWSGQKRHTSPEIAMLKDDFGMSYEAINKAMDDLAQDAGRENNANAKRLELVIDQILTKGHRTLGGREFPPNQAYIEAKSKIAGYVPKQKAESAIDDDFMRAEFGDSSGESSADAKPAMGDIGDMGAKTSDFPHEVKESKSKTTPRYYEQNNIPEEGRADNHYTERTWAEARHNANVSLEQDYDGEVDDLTRKTVWSDEDSFKAEIILEDIHKKARETGDWSEHQKWSKVFAQHKEELGRAFSALRGLHKNTVETILADASASLENAVKGTDANAVMRQVDEYATRYEKASETKNVDGLLEIIRDTSATRKTGTREGGLSKEIDWALNRMAEYARAELAAGKQAGTLEAGKFYDFLQNFAANGIKAIATDKQKISFGQGYRTIQHNSILSKFLTIMRNLVNNGVLDPLDSFSGNLVVPLDALLSQYTKTRSVAYDKSWFSEAKRKGSLDGMAMALLEIGLDVNGDGKAGKYEDVGKRTFHMANGGIAKFISAWEKYSGYVMGATDEFTKGGVRDEVQRGIDSLYEQNKIKDDTLRNAGEQAALYRTLQDETIPSKIVTGARRALNHAQIGGLGLGDVTIKFAQVPANLPARAADFSPVGLVRGLGKMAKVLIDAKNGKLTAAQQASAVKDIGRGITGSGLILASTALALKGIIHVVAPGGEDENKDKAASEQAQGLKETQLNLSALLRSIKGEDTAWRYGDKMVSFGFLDPINAHLMTGALIAEDIEEARKAGEKIGLGDILTDSLQGTIHALLDLPLMDPINDIRYAWQKSDGDNEVEKAWDVVEQGVAGEVTSFIPNALKGIAQGIDPYQRDMYSKDDLVGRTVDQIIGGIPGWRQTLPIKQDVYGNDVKNPDQPLNFLNANILPGAITTYTETDLQKALNDLSEQSGSNSMYLSKDAPKSITVDGEEFKLTKAQQAKFMAERGDIYAAASAALENNEAYQNFSTDWKVQAYAEAENYAVQTAKDGLGTKFEPVDWVKDLEGASPEEIAEAMVQRVVSSVANKHKGGKYAGLGDMLDNGTIDDDLAIALLPPETHKKYMEHGKKVPVSDLVDALAYKNSEEVKASDKKPQELFEDWLDNTYPGPKNKKLRIGLWCSIYAESTCPW